MRRRRADGAWAGSGVLGSRRWVLCRTRTGGTVAAATRLTGQHPCTWPGSSDAEWWQGQEVRPLRGLVGPVLGPSRAVGWGFSPHSLGTLCLPLGTRCSGGSPGKRRARHTAAPLEEEALHLQMTGVSALVFLPVHPPTAPWLPWPWKSSKLRDARQRDTRHEAALLRHPRHPPGQGQRPSTSATSPAAVLGPNKVS